MASATDDGARGHADCHAVDDNRPVQHVDAGDAPSTGALLLAGIVRSTIVMVTRDPLRLTAT